MYSASWFSTFADTIPRSATEAEVTAISHLVPLPEYRRVLDVGCGTGRVLSPLASLGYEVTGIDMSLAALQTARRSSAAASFVALDQRHVGTQRWSFDAAIVLWNSFGFGSREDDRLTLMGLHAGLRPGECTAPGGAQLKRTGVHMIGNIGTQFYTWLIDGPELRAEEHEQRQHARM